jgi:SNF2 family DNA or RNA helicase
MRPRSKMFRYQEEAVARIVASQQMACFLEPGLGKTSVALTAINDLGRPRTLVLAPARVAREVWHAEAAQWEHIRGLRVVPATGTDVRANLKRAVQSNAGVIVTGYENLPWLLDNCDVAARFDALIMDELSKMKTPGATRFRKLRSVLPKIPVRIGLTGTPVGNHLIDIWGEMYCIAGPKPLGPSVEEFKYRYFRPKARRGHIVYSWETLAGSEAEIHRRIKPWAFTLRPSDAPKLADLRVNEIRVELPPRVLEMSRELADDLVTEMASGAELTAFSGNVAAMKVRQMAGGAVYLDPPTVLGEPPPKVRGVEHVHDEKLNALADLVDELQGSPLLTFYWFRHERERLLKRFPQAVDIDAPDAMARWNRGEVEMLLAHPASAGHGLNLQHGGHHICWFTLPYSLEMWKQAIGRLIRHGQKSPWVMAHVLLAGRADEVVLSALHRKRVVEDALLDAMLA